MNSDDRNKPITFRESFDGFNKLQPKDQSLERLKNSVEGAGGLRPVVPVPKTIPTSDEKKK